MAKRVQANGWLESGDEIVVYPFRVSHPPADHPSLNRSEHGQTNGRAESARVQSRTKAAREGRSRSWSEPWAYPFESNQHYEERREAFNQGYGIIDATHMSFRRSPP